MADDDNYVSTNCGLASPSSRHGEMTRQRIYHHIWLFVVSHNQGMGLTLLGTLTCDRAAPVNCSPLPHYHPGIRHRSLSTNKLPASTLMSHSKSHSHLTAVSSSNFQLIFDNALKAYEKRTKNDLLVHPLASQLQACDSPDAILAVLQQQVQGLDQSQNSDDRLSKWLGPTVNILYSLSETLGEGICLVTLET